MREYCQLVPDQDAVLFDRSAAPGQHVIAIGEDIAAGQVALSAGRRLRPQDIALLTALQVDCCWVVRQPRVRLLVTGSELVPPGTPPSAGQIIDSNTPMLTALIQRDGGVLLELQRRPDQLVALRQALHDARDSLADLLLVCGGSSQGDQDYMPQLVAEMGELLYHGVAIKPGKPTAVGWLHRDPTPLPVVLLPGYPAACLAAYELVAGRILRCLAGRDWNLPHRTRILPLQASIPSQLGRLDWVRVRLHQQQAVPLLQRGASSIYSLSEADGFVLVPEEVAEYPAHTLVTVYLFDD
jgi:molybdopterin molybdotransferase